MAEWPLWAKADPMDLAHYVVPDAAKQAALARNGTFFRDAAARMGQGTFHDLVRLDRAKAVEALYEQLRSTGIDYALEPLVLEDRYGDRQRVRPPDAVLARGSGEGTCLDLALALAGLCLSQRLLPVVCLLEAADGAHALVVVDLTADPDQGGRVDEPLPGDNFRADVLGDEHSRYWVVVECTGFARTRALAGHETGDTVAFGEARRQALGLLRDQHLWACVNIPAAQARGKDPYPVVALDWDELLRVNPPRTVGETNPYHDIALRKGDVGPGYDRETNLPPYVDRPDLDAALDRALAPGRGVVLVHGSPGTGKTRSAFEALRREWPERQLVVPNPPPAGDLQLLVRSLDDLCGPAEAVLWLDDVQGHLRAGQVDADGLHRLCERGLLVVATIWEHELGELKSAAAGGEAGRAGGLSQIESARLFIDRAREVKVPREDSPDTVARAREAYPDVQFDEAFGVAESISAAPLVRGRFTTMAETPAFCVAASAIDLVRAGLTAVEEGTLRELFPTCRRRQDPGINPRQDWTAAFQGALEEASEQIGETRQRVLRWDEQGRLRPFEPLVHDAERVGEAIPDDTWRAALAWPASDRFAVGTNAYLQGRLDIMEEAMTPLAEAGDARAMFNLGVLLEDRDPARAEQWLEMAAAAGHAGAMNNLGVLLEDRDPARAEQWYRKAAQSGHTVAMVNLGVLLKHRDPAQAEQWYRKAAQSGNADAMFNLGVVLKQRDPAQAEQWYLQAAQAGHAKAMYNLAQLLVDSDSARAEQWYLKAAQADDARAMTNLGLLLVDRDPAMAEQWWSKAAEAGDALAMFNLGVLLEDRDPARAEQWLEKAAEADHAGAMNNLGVLLEDRDPARAEQWYLKAAEAGHARAMHNLGVLLKDRDPTKAKEWLEKAAQAGLA